MKMEELVEVVDAVVVNTVDESDGDGLDELTTLNLKQSSSSPYHSAGLPSKT